MAEKKKLWKNHNPETRPYKADHIDLTEMLMNQINDLNAGMVDIATAKEVSNAVGKMVGLSKVALESGKMVGEIPEVPIVNMKGSKKK